MVAILVAPPTEDADPWTPQLSTLTRQRCEDPADPPRCVNGRVRARTHPSAHRRGTRAREGTRGTARTQAKAQPAPAERGTGPTRRRRARHRDRAIVRRASRHHLAPAIMAEQARDDRASPAEGASNVMNPRRRGGGDELSPMTKPLCASFGRSSSIGAHVVAPARPKRRLPRRATPLTCRDVTG